MAESRSVWRVVTWDNVIRLVALLLIIHEAVLRMGPERPSLLILYAGMLGGPSVLSADFRRRRNGNGNGDV